jgi:hypothetical protein
MLDTCSTSPAQRISYRGAGRDSQVEEQLMAWSYLLRDGKTLRIDISFIYKETTQPVALRRQQSTRRGGVTALQLAES